MLYILPLSLNVNVHKWKSEMLKSNKSLQEKNYSCWKIIKGGQISSPILFSKRMLNKVIKISHQWCMEGTQQKINRWSVCGWLAAVGQQNSSISSHNKIASKLITCNSEHLFCYASQLQVEQIASNRWSLLIYTMAKLKIARYYCW